MAIKVKKMKGHIVAEPAISSSSNNAYLSIDKDGAVCIWSEIQTGGYRQLEETDFELGSQGLNVEDGNQILKDVAPLYQRYFKAKTRKGKDAALEEIKEYVDALNIAPVICLDEAMERAEVDCRAARNWVTAKTTDDELDSLAEYVLNGNGDEDSRWTCDADEDEVWERLKEIRENCDEEE